MLKFFLIILKESIRNLHFQAEEKLTFSYLPVIVGNKKQKNKSCLFILFFLNLQKRKSFLVF